MPVRPLPDDPSFEHLRKDAKRLRNGIRSGDATMLAQVREFHPRAGDVLIDFSLADAQLVTARSYGFASWTKLKQHLAVVDQFAWNPPPIASGSTTAVDAFVRLACMDYGTWHRSNPEKAQRLLDENPALSSVDIHAAAAAGEVAVVRSMLDRDPALVNRRGGVLRWEPLLYACYSRARACGEPLDPRGGPSAARTWRRSQRRISLGWRIRIHGPHRRVRSWRRLAQSTAPPGVR